MNATEHDRLVPPKADCTSEAASSFPMRPVSGQPLGLSTRQETRRLWGVALLLALGAHAVLTAVLVLTATHTAPVRGQDSVVSMVFEPPATSAPPMAPLPDSMEPLPDTPPLTAPDVPAPADVTLPLLPAKLGTPPHTALHAAASRMALSLAVHGPTQGAEATTGHGQADKAAPSAATPPATGGGKAHGLLLSCAHVQTHYPPMARHLHEEGTAVVEAALDPSGHVLTARLFKTSGFDDLDDAAVEAVRGLQCTLPEGGAITGHIPVVFHLH